MDESGHGESSLSSIYNVFQALVSLRESLKGLHFKEAVQQKVLLTPWCAKGVKIARFRKNRTDTVREPAYFS